MRPIRDTESRIVLGSLRVNDLWRRVPPPFAVLPQDPELLSAIRFHDTDKIQESPHPPPRNIRSRHP